MVASPGYANQSMIRTVFRVGGLLLLAAGVTLTLIGLLAFFDTMTADSMEGPPEKFFLAFLGLPLMAVGGWCLQAGFGGLAARYAAGEAMRVVKDSAAYLTDGEGLVGVGRTSDDEATKFCSSCGRPGDLDARFCESCGHAFS